MKRIKDLEIRRVANNLENYELVRWQENTFSDGSKPKETCYVLAFFKKGSESYDIL